MTDEMLERVLGDPMALSAAIGVSVDLIYVWRQRRSVPAHHVQEVSGATGIAPHLIKPSVFKEPSKKPQSKRKASA